MRSSGTARGRLAQALGLRIGELPANEQYQPLSAARSAQSGAAEKQWRITSHSARLLEGVEALRHRVLGPVEVAHVDHDRLAHEVRDRDLRRERPALVGRARSGRGRSRARSRRPRRPRRAAPARESRAAASSSKPVGAVGMAADRGEHRVVRGGELDHARDSSPRPSPTVRIRLHPGLARGGDQLGLGRVAERYVGVGVDHAASLGAPSLAPERDLRLKRKVRLSTSVSPVGRIGRRDRWS